MGYTYEEDRLFEEFKGKKYDHTLKWIAEEEPQGFFEWLMEVLGREGFTLKEVNVSKELAPAPRYIDSAILDCWQVFS